MNNKSAIFTSLLIGSALIADLSPALQARDAGNGRSGAVYTLSNDPAGNRVLAFDRAKDGTLTPSGSVASGGTGNGSNLGSQGAIVLSSDKEWLFAVNAGSDSISSFAIRNGGLVLAGTAASGGTTPVSLTVHGSLLYVLNQGGTGNITGFRVGPHGELKRIDGSTRPLSNLAAGAAQVSFSPDQETLVVSEKNTQTLDTYRLGDDDRVAGPTGHPSNGLVPFGFTFAGQDTLLVTEAGSNAVSSYNLDGRNLDTVSPSVPSEGAAPCWITVSGHGRFAFASNAHIGTIAGFRVSREGDLTFLGLTQTSSIPVLDMGSTPDFVYALAGGTHEILAYQVERDGSLSSLTGAAGLPATAVGLAVR